MPSGGIGVVPSCSFVLFPALYICFLEIKNKLVFFLILFLRELSLFCLQFVYLKNLLLHILGGEIQKQAFGIKNEKVNIAALKGFKFSSLEKKKYEDLNRIIEKNTNKDSTIWGFPYTKVYNIFQIIII